MNSFLLRFEAIESRIASLPCPLGTTGRIRSLRLQRAQQTTRRPQVRYATTLQSLDADNEPLPFHTTRYDSSSSASGAGLIERALIISEASRVSPDQKNWTQNGLNVPVSGQLSISGRPHRSIKKVIPNTYERLTSLDPAYLMFRVQAAVQSGQHDQVLHEILRQISFVGLNQYAREVLAAVPATTFSEILNALNPKQHIDRFSQLYEEISSQWTKNLKLPHPNAFGRHEFLVRFLKHISVILSARAASHPLSVQDYKILLKCARAVGDPDAAKLIWQQLQHHIFEETVKAEKDPQHQIPLVDVECYNHYMAALCWSDVLNPYHRHHLRVTARTLTNRGHDPTHFHLSGHRVGPGGLKSIVANLFQRMIQAKVSPNEETFCLMAISIAREGELDAVSSLLKRAWGLDVEAILAGESTDDLQTKNYDISDPLRPSEQLLMTLAHAYSVNKSIPAAIQLVDHVSQQYSIPISPTVWTELLERSVMLSSPNSDEPDTQIKRVAVSNLYETMTAEPYNVEPNMRIFNFLIGSELQQQRFGKVQERMAQALKLHHAEVSKLSQLVDARSNKESLAPSADVKRRQIRDIEFQHLRVKVNRQYIRRWIRLWFYRASRSLARGHQAHSFSSQNAPYMIEKYKSYLPRVVKYRTATGLVELHSHSRTANQLHHLSHSDRNGVKMVRSQGRRVRSLGQTPKDGRNIDSQRLLTSSE